MLRWCVLVALAVLGLLYRRYRDALPPLHSFRPVVLEPDGLGAALRALPQRRLGPAELETLRREGVLHVRGLLPSRALARWLLEGTRSYATFFEASILQTYLHNGYVAALVRDGPLGPLMADALQSEAVSVTEAPIFGIRRQDAVRFVRTHWHADLHAGFQDQPMISVWLAVADAPHSLEFLPGSHTMRVELQAACNMSGKGLVHSLDDECSQRFVRERLDFPPASRFPWWADLAAGDALIFHGNVAHRGVSWHRGRVAVALRYKPSPVRGECGRNGTWLTWELAVHPPSPDNFACLRVQWLARVKKVWPRMDTSLPTDEDWGRHAWAARLVRRAAEVATTMVFRAVGDKPVRPV